MTTSQQTATIENGTLHEELIEKSPFESKSEANSLIYKRTLYSTRIGLIPFPAVDAALVLGVQIWMIRDLANIYNVEFKEKIARSLTITLVGNLGIVGGIKLIPGVGSVIGSFTTAITAGAATFAIGKVFEQHFSQGGTLLDFDPISSRAYFQTAFEEGKLVVADLKEAEKDSNKLLGIKKVWNKWIKKSPPKEDTPTEEQATLAEIQKTNEELKLAIVKLQETMESLSKDQAN